MDFFNVTFCLLLVSRRQSCPERISESSSSDENNNCRRDLRKEKAFGTNDNRELRDMMLDNKNERKQCSRCCSRVK